MAAGFSIRRHRLDDFAAFLTRRIELTGEAVATERAIQADAVLSAPAATPLLLDGIERAGPFGAGNPEPVFLMPDMLVVYAAIVGGSHVRLRAVARDGQGIGAIAFRAVGTELGTALLNSRGRRIHVAGKLRRDDYEGIVKVQFQIEDAAAAEA